MEKILTVCPYCGSGCKLNLLVEDGKVTGAEGADGVTNQGQLCLKGYYGWDFLNDTGLLTPRLTHPMIRRERGGPLEKVTWQEAIAYTASRLADIKDKYGASAIMTTGSSRGTGNETNYVMQKFTRAVLGSNNVDCCARVCHGPSVAGLQATLGNGAMSNSITEIENSDCLLIIGYNAADSHPIVARRILKAKQRGAKVIVCDPRYIESARLADLWLPLRNGSNMALVNAFANVLIEEDLYDKTFVAQHTEGFEEFRQVVAKYTPEFVADITGLAPQLIRDAIRMYANGKKASLLWGMGVTQWGQGVEVVKGLAGLALLTGNLGRPDVGVGPVRGQNNVQGACDMGALPNTYPGYQSVTDKAVLKKFAKAWGVKSLSDQVGYGITDISHKALSGEIKAYYVMGEDPLQTEPDLSQMRQAFDALDLVIVQDIFMTKTAARADVILPSTSWGEHEGIYTCADRGFQHFNKAIEPKGDVKTDWQIISLIASEMGYPMKYENTQEIWDELRALCPLYAGVTYEKLAGLGYVQWPCPEESHPGTPYLYEGNHFSRPNGKGLLVASEWIPPREAVSPAFPLVLCTVREVGHYSCRSMTGNCTALQTLADEPGYVQIHPQDAENAGIEDNQLVWISSPRGRVVSRASVSERTNAGAIYMTYQWWIGACNELTLDHLDPTSKTPEYKHCSANITAIADQKAAESDVQRRYQALKNDLKSAAGLIG
ncbi:formate dehydrogenase subunit alpha [Rahnella woolbedingensis]|uniref:Formate dehydrogenase subunit alpha n=1 Tax=Rahnella woolbedingensis TaxID=1510574 RepID=A0A419N688_9GAMM|nr:formate dehydrogenase subunit alpha [Rahnella woolbedingensis]RJT42242.1 formate dehydrogenase subunit alpha [Rahnella woolbedingensis]